MRTSALRVLLPAIVACTVLAAQEQPAAKPAAPRVARTNLVTKAEAPTESDMYCSGYIAPQRVAATTFIAAGWDTPFQTRFSDRDLVYLTGGSFEKGQKFQIIRPMRDTNRYEMYKGQNANIKALGTPYQEMGRVSVMEVQRGIGIAEVEFSCDGFTPGDIAVAWPDRPAPQFRRKVPFDQFAVPNGKLTGKIVMINEFDVTASSKSKVYLNVGSNQGVKPGDYFRSTRTYKALYADESDGMSVKASIVEPLLDHPPVFAKTRADELPRKSIGEMVVLFTTPTTTTAMITRSLEQVQIGDLVELMDELPPLPPEPEATANAPTLNCIASPTTIRVGETATIRCAAVSPDERPLTYAFSADNGNLMAHGDSATLDARNARPGMANVTTTVNDDRNLSASAVTSVNVEGAGNPEASKTGELYFKPSNAFVNNTAKAVLDDVALRMQREANSSLMLVGFSDDKEASRLGLARATNAKTYLTREKGIDAGRIQTADGGKGGSKVDIWFVPAGAAMPRIATPVATPATVVPVKPAAKPMPKAAATTTKPAAKPAPKSTPPKQ